MAQTDYDARRVRPDADPDQQYPTKLAIRSLDVTRIDAGVEDGEPLTLPDDLDIYGRTDDETMMPVVAQRSDEFVCARCFLVLHRSRYAGTRRAKPVCRDCS